jgi:hypothetical protein
VSPEVNKYLAQKDQGFVANEPQSQHAGARWKRLPVRLSDTRCPPTMPFPADPAKTPDSLVALAWDWFTDGNTPFVKVTAAEPRGWDDTAVERIEELAVGSLPAAFFENFERRRRTSARTLRAPIE